MKLETVIYKAYQKLKNNNIKSAMLDSELLMAKAINESREYIILNSNKDIGEKDYNNFQTMITQRSNGKPIACLLYTSPSPRDRSLSRMPSSA